MEVLWPVLCVMLCALSAAFFVKLKRLQKSNDEICTQLEQILSTDTNNTIFVSSQSKSAKKTASALNKQLKVLREMRRRYINGDRELKNTISAISHDIRTPLTAIRGYLDLLSSESGSENAGRYLTIIQNRTAEMIKLTEELYSYSVSQTEQKELSLERVNIKAVLEESLAAFYAVLQQRGITPITNICDAPVYAELDRTALSRIFQNIISNALKYSDGDLEIALGESKTVIFKNTARALNNVEAGKLFNRFYTVDSAQNSGGLGLAIAKTLTLRMGGDISAEYKDEKLIISLKF